MATFSKVGILVGAFVLAAVIDPAHADPVGATASSSVARKAPAPAELSACAGVSADEAHRLAKEAQQEGDHRRAAECFRMAGEHARADHAMIRASAEMSEKTMRKVAADAEVAKMQARQLREAFR